MSRLLPPLNVRLVDPDAERVRRNLSDRITEIQGVPIVQGKLFRDVELPNGVRVAIPHGFGRRASVLCSPVRGAQAALSSSTFNSRIEQVTEFGDIKWDPNKFVVLRATAWNATVYVDVWVF